MEKTSSPLSPDEKIYNDQCLLLDGLYEFHPEAFTRLTGEAMRCLQEYYLTGKSVPEDVFEYRRRILATDPLIEKKATAAFQKLCSVMGIATQGD